MTEHVTPNWHRRPKEDVGLYEGTKDKSSYFPCIFHIFNNNNKKGVCGGGGAYLLLVCYCGTDLGIYKKEGTQL